MSVMRIIPVGLRAYQVRRAKRQHPRRELTPEARGVRSIRFAAFPHHYCPATCGCVQSAGLSSAAGTVIPGTPSTTPFNCRRSVSTA